jgi:hypothetical protein
MGRTLASIVVAAAITLGCSAICGGIAEVFRGGARDAEITAVNTGISSRTYHNNQEEIEKIRKEYAFLSDKDLWYLGVGGGIGAILGLAMGIGVTIPIPKNKGEGSDEFVGSGSQYAGDGTRGDYRGGLRG